MNRVLSESAPSAATWTSPGALAPLVNFGGLSNFNYDCGNPAPGFSVTCTAAAGTTAGRVLLSNASWNPADGCPECPVSTIRMELEHRNVATVAPGQLVWPAIVQGVSLYVGPPLAAFANVWTPMTWSLTAAQFCNVTGAGPLGLLTACGTNPNFACTATPLSFGFVVTVSSAVLTTRTHCYDNFRVILDCPAQFTTFCTGCLNCGGVPPAIWHAGGLPTIGNPFFQITETGACPSIPTFLIIGASKTNWGGGALPFNLGSLGYPACNLCVSPDIILTATTSPFGAAAANIPIQNNVYLIGARFYAQWIDFGGMVLGMSNAAEVTIGV